MEQIVMNTQIANKNEKKLDERYLLQIKRIKLIDYINCGLIIPDKYLSEECEKDIQSKNKDFLVVCDGYIKELDEYQILLELIFTDDQKEKLHKVNDLYYFDFPLPITRIKKVYVQSSDIKKHIEVQIQNSENGFLPKELFDLYTKRNKIIFKQKTYNLLDEHIEVKNYETQIRYFDKRMGMFSFIKNTELYYSDSTNKISNYSNHYFEILSDSFKEIDNLLASSEDFKKLIYSNRQIDTEFLRQEADKIEDMQLKEIFLQLTKPIRTRETLSQLLEYNSLEHYLIGLVYHFRQKRANKKDSIKQDIENLIPYEVAEISLAILGIYFGYRTLRSQEKIELINRDFKKIFGGIFNMKFNFESKLDYITVETIYNICFKNKEHKGYEYEYLPYPSKKTLSLKIPTDKKFKIWYQVQKNKYYDVEQITIKKLSTLEVFTHLLGKYSDDIVENRQTRYLIPFVQYTFGDILTFNTNGQIYFKKDDLLKKLKLLEDEKINNELIDIINIGKN